MTHGRSRKRLNKRALTCTCVVEVTTCSHHLSGTRSARQQLRRSRRSTAGQCVGTSTSSCCSDASTPPALYRRARGGWRSASGTKRLCGGERQAASCCSGSGVAAWLVGWLVMVIWLVVWFCIWFALASWLGGNIIWRGLLLVPYLCLVCHHRYLSIAYTTPTS